MNGLADLPIEMAEQITMEASMSRSLMTIFRLLTGITAFNAPATAMANVGLTDPNPGEVIDLSTIGIETSFHFSTSEGNSVVVPAGSYQVNQDRDSQLMP